MDTSDLDEEGITSFGTSPVVTPVSSGHEPGIRSCRLEVRFLSLVELLWTSCVLRFFTVLPEVLDAMVEGWAVLVLADLEVFAACLPVAPEGCEAPLLELAECACTVLFIPGSDFDRECGELSTPLAEDLFVGSSSGFLEIFAVAFSIALGASEVLL